MPHLNSNYTYHTETTSVWHGNKWIHSSVVSLSLQCFYTKETADEDTDTRKQEGGGKKTRHITGNRGTSYALIARVCECFTGHVEMGLPGKTIETQERSESQHQQTLGSTTFHIMIRYHRRMTNHHFWHCGCINCLHRTSSITPAGRS